jgi:hypothetical protein
MASWETFPEFSVHVIVATMKMSTFMKNLIRHFILITISLPMGFFPYWRPRFYSNPTGVVQKSITLVLKTWITVAVLVMYPLMVALLVTFIASPIFWNIRITLIRLINTLFYENMYQYVFPAYKTALHHLMPLTYTGINCSSQSASFACKVQNVILLPYSAQFISYEYVIRGIMSAINFVLLSETSIISKILFVPIWAAMCASIGVHVQYAHLMFPQFYYLGALLNTVRACNFLLAQTIAIPARICYSLGVLGQLILIPITIVWMFWPLYIPYRFGNNAL